MFANITTATARCGFSAHAATVRISPL